MELSQLLVPADGHPAPDAAVSVNAMGTQGGTKPGAQAAPADEAAVDGASVAATFAALLDRSVLGSRPAGAGAEDGARPGTVPAGGSTDPLTLQRLDLSGIGGAHGTEAGSTPGIGPTAGENGATGPAIRIPGTTVAPSTTGPDDGDGSATATAKSATITADTIPDVTKVPIGGIAPPISPADPEISARDAQLKAQAAWAAKAATTPLATPPAGDDEAPGYPPTAKPSTAASEGAGTGTKGAGDPAVDPSAGAQDTDPAARQGRPVMRPGAAERAAAAPGAATDPDPALTASSQVGAVDAEPAPGPEAAGEKHGAGSTDAATARQAAGARNTTTAGTTIRAQVAAGLADRIPAAGEERITLRLDPAQLGRVDVQIVARGEKLSIVFTAETAEVQRALGERADDLVEALLQRGGRFNEIEVRSGREGTEDKQKYENSESRRRERDEAGRGRDGRRRQQRQQRGG